jgi:hypothetical protein
MRGFPDAYTIYTANREQCWNPHHSRHDESVTHLIQHVLSRDGCTSQALAHTLKFGYPLRGVVPLRRGPHDQ